MLKKFRKFILYTIIGFGLLLTVIAFFDEGSSALLMFFVTVFLVFFIGVPLKILEVLLR